MLLVTLGPFTALFIMTSPSHLQCSVPWGLTAPVYGSRESVRWVHLTVQARPSWGKSTQKNACPGVQPPESSHGPCCKENPSETLWIVLGLHCHRCWKAGGYPWSQSRKRSANRLQLHVSHGLETSFQRILEYPELEETHRDHPVQPLLCRTGPTIPPCI